MKKIWTNLLPIVILSEKRVLQLVVDLAAQFGHDVWMIGRHRRQFTLHRVPHHVIDHLYVKRIKRFEPIGILVLGNLSVFHRNTSVSINHLYHLSLISIRYVFSRDVSSVSSFLPLIPFTYLHSICTFMEKHSTHRIHTRILRT